MLRAVMQPQYDVPGDWAPPPLMEQDFNLPGDTRSPAANDSQKLAVCSLNYALEKIQGPPGTGKSTTIYHIINQRVPPGRGLHSSTFQLNLSLFGHTSPYPPI